MTLTYKELTPFADRCTESRKIMDRYVDRIPVIITAFGKNTPICPRNKFLVLSNSTVGHLAFTIRGHAKLDPESALFVYIGNSIPPTSATISEIYAKDKEDDGFLYITYSVENTFG